MMVNSFHIFSYNFTVFTLLQYTEKNPNFFTLLVQVVFISIDFLLKYKVDDIS